MTKLPAWRWRGLWLLGVQLAIGICICSIGLYVTLANELRMIGVVTRGGVGLVFGGVSGLLIYTCDYYLKSVCLKGCRLYYSIIQRAMSGLLDCIIKAAFGCIMSAGFIGYVFIDILYHFAVACILPIGALILMSAIVYSIRKGAFSESICREDIDDMVTKPSAHGRVSLHLVSVNSKITIKCRTLETAEADLIRQWWHLRQLAERVRPGQE